MSDSRSKTSSARYTCPKQTKQNKTISEHVYRKIGIQSDDPILKQGWSQYILRLCVGAEVIRLKSHPLNWQIQEETAKNYPF